MLLLDNKTIFVLKRTNPLLVVMDRVRKKDIFFIEKHISMNQLGRLSFFLFIVGLDITGNAINQLSLLTLLQTASY